MTALNFPLNPTVGQVYTSGTESWSWSGSAWTITPQPSTYTPVFIGTFAPLSPSAGDLWWDSTTGRLYVYYTDTDGSQWVSAFSPPDTVITVTSAQVITALLDGLPAHATIAAAQAAGLATGQLFKITGATDVTGIRSVCGNP